MNASKTVALKSKRNYLHFLGGTGPPLSKLDKQSVLAAPPSSMQKWQLQGAESIKFLLPREKEKR